LRKVEKLTGRIEGLRSDLVHFVNPQTGLLDALFSHHVLTRQQIEDIKRMNTTDAQVDRLLDHIIELSHIQRELFLTTLEQNKQGHMAKFIRANGLVTHAGDDDEDDWPLHAYKDELKILDGSWSQLLELIDPNTGLLDELISEGVLNRQNKQYVRLAGAAHQTDHDKNETLLNILRRKGIKDYRKFIECLVKTEQYTAAKLLDPSSVTNREIRFLSEEHKDKLQGKNYSALINIIEVTGGLVPQLFATNCITRRQKEYIETASTQSEANERILDIILRGDETKFDDFIRCLTETGQHEVVRILTEPGVMAQRCG
jgi:Caspase recruitment domain